MLDGLGASGGQQPDHLRHRVKNRATGLDSGEPILYCALRSQPSNVAQGRVLLNRGLEDETVENSSHRLAPFVRPAEPRSVSVIGILHQLSDGVRDADLTSAISQKPVFGNWDFRLRTHYGLFGSN